MSLVEIKLAQEMVEKRIEAISKTQSYYPNQHPELNEELDMLQELRNRADELLLKQSIQFLKGE